MLRWFYAALGVLLLASSATLWVQTQRLEKAQDELLKQGISLEACRVRVSHLRTEKENDATVSHPIDFRVPDHWMFDPAR